MRIPNVAVPAFFRPADLFAFLLGLGSALLLSLHLLTPPGALSRYDAVRSAAAAHGLNPRFVAAVVEAASRGRVDFAAADGRRGLMGLTEEAPGDGAPSAAAQLDRGCRRLAGALEAARGRPRLAMFAFREGTDTVSEAMQSLPHFGAAEIVASSASAETRAFIDRAYEAWGRFEPDPWE